MIRRLFTTVPIVLIRFYRRVLSPMKGRPTCRFCPTCSLYAIKAFEEWGLIGGGARAVWRILRCNPFGRGGFDPVMPGGRPPKRKKRADFMRSRTDRFPFITTTEK